MGKINDLLTAQEEIQRLKYSSSKRNPLVVIDIRGGIVTCISSTIDMEVHIIDHDQYEVGEEGHIEPEVTVEPRKNVRAWLKKKARRGT